MRAKNPLKKCPIPECWEMTSGGRLCDACRSWWGRLSLYTPGQLAHYLQRLGRFAGRRGWRGIDRTHLKLVRGGTR